MRIFTAIAGVLGVAAVALGATDASSRYDIILKRQPFWNPPPPPAPRQRVVPVKKPVPQKSFTDDIRMCGITQTKNGLRVGFVVSGGRGRNRSQNSYYLFVGESEDEIEVVSADFEGEKALLRKGDQEGWICMREQEPAEQPEPPKVSSPAVAPIAGRTMRQAKALAAGRVPRPITSYRDLLKKREEERARKLKEDQERKKKELAARSELTGEALQKHLQDYNLKLIRAKGELGPPLPIPLTAEQDAQLVEEGVLPPRE